MTCAELRTRLEAYVRGTLSPAEGAALETHLEGCAECTAFLEAAEPALVETGSLRSRIDPEADLWPRIHPRLSSRGSGARRRFPVPAWMLAAAAVLLVAVSSGVTALLLRSPSRRAAEPPSLAAEPPSRRAAELEAQYGSATAELALALEKAKSRLAPATMATIERNLATIDSALAESRRALAGDPGNATLEQLVVAAWRQKMDFLRRATALASET